MKDSAMRELAMKDSAMPANVLALDVGQARIGLAAGRVGSRLAFGKGYITRGKQREDVAAVLDKMKREKAALLVVGLPRRTDGSDSPQTQRVRSFAKALEEAGAEVILEDERFTTRVATQDLRRGGGSRKKRREKGRVDEASAVLILETFLAKQLSQTAQDE